jgi:hypothetical protein
MSAEGDLEVVDYGFSGPKTGGNGVKLIHTMRGSIAVMLAMQVAFIVLYGACAEVTLDEDFTNRYFFNTGIVFMMFFGFGYLMTFLKRYGMGSVGFTMLITCFTLQWGILTEVNFGYFF